MRVVAVSILELTHVDLLLLLGLGDVESALSGWIVQVLQEIMHGDVLLVIQKNRLVLDRLLLFVFLLIDELKFLLETQEIGVAGELIRDVLPDHFFEQVDPDPAVLANLMQEVSCALFQGLIRHPLRPFVAAAHEHHHAHEALGYLFQPIELAGPAALVQQELLLLLHLLPVLLQQSLNHRTHNNTLDYTLSSTMIKLYGIQFIAGGCASGPQVAGQGRLGRCQNDGQAAVP